MNCRQVKEHIERYYEGVLPVADELGVDIHLVQCAVCAEELGGIGDLVEECHDAFDALPSSSDLDGLHSGMDELATEVALQDDEQSRFRKKDVLMHLVLALVAIPVFWLVSVSALETYAAYSDIVPNPAAESRVIPDGHVPLHVSRNAAIIDL